jgi:hypothetical protein
VKGLRFERIGKNRYYNVVFHMGSSYVPVRTELKSSGDAVTQITVLQGAIRDL